MSSTEGGTLNRGRKHMPFKVFGPQIPGVPELAEPNRVSGYRGSGTNERTLNTLGWAWGPPGVRVLIVSAKTSLRWF